MLSRLVLLLFLLHPLSALGREMVLGNKFISLRFNPTTNVLAVKDKRSGIQWEQQVLALPCGLQNSIIRNDTLHLSFRCVVPLLAKIWLGKNASVHVLISGDADQQIQEFAFPGAFATRKDDFIVMTDGEGILLPAEDKLYPLGSGITYYCGGGLSMPWMGVVDRNLEAGYMAILETPYDAALRPERKAERIVFHPVWLPSRGRLSYDRKVTYYFFDKGGYVNQCKTYREYVKSKHGLVMLKEKVQQHKEMQNIGGSVHIYVWSDGRKGPFLSELKNAGISKAMLLWNPNHLPYPTREYYDSANAHGYAIGAYELFTDIYPRDTVKYDVEYSRTPLRRNVFPGQFYNLTARRQDGSTYSHQYGHFVCPKAVLPQIMKRSNREMLLYKNQTYFMDVYAANGLHECYSKEHPCSREEWSDAIRQNQMFLQNDHRLVLGAEWGSDFAINQYAYAHGMMTLQRTWFDSEITKKGSIYWWGNWSNNEKPSQMLGIRTAPPIYMRYSINETLRVPLFSLVYHDAIVTSWRWEDCNYHTPEIWWKKDLFNILYGSVPLWNLDVDRWNAFRTNFIDSYNKIIPWLERIAFDEMISHRFISRERDVQETTFSSGKKVIVNFGERDFVFHDRSVGARSYLIIE